MWLTIGLAFVAGFFAGNGIPYYVQGSTGRGVNPSPFPDSPTVSVLVGWTAMIIAGVSAYFADFPAYPFAGAVSAAVGWLVVGLIHARNWQANPWRKNTAGAGEYPVESG